jgi:tetratricopeptide (TPR) repeat protein
MRSSLTPLVKLFYNPLQAIAELQARAPLVAGALLALTSSFIYYNALSGELQVFMWPFIKGAPAPHPSVIIINLFRLLRESAAPVIFLAVVFVPACLLASSIVDRRSSFGVLLRQEYSPLASSVLYGWATAHLLMFIPAWLLFQPGDLSAAVTRLGPGLVPLPYFIFLVTLALRVVLRLGLGRALAVMALGGFSLVALPLLPGVVLLLSSPFLAILVIFFLINFLGEMVSAQQAREHFKQNLEMATLNPADASAHYNLGLIYQQRGRYDEAVTCFERAVAIDPRETDAHYQLGRIAREQGRLADAIKHFDVVATHDPEHSQNEVWREVGRTYFQAGQYTDARSAFERFLDRRPSDAEGRYHYALTLHRLGLGEMAATEMRAVIEAVRTSPAYKYRAEKRWMNEAQSFLRSQSA